MAADKIKVIPRFDVRKTPLWRWLETRHLGPWGFCLHKSGHMQHGRRVLQKQDWSVYHR